MLPGPVSNPVGNQRQRHGLGYLDSVDTVLRFMRAPESKQPP